MDKIIVGSIAAKYWFEDFRRPRDLDIVTEEEVFLDGRTSFFSYEFYKNIKPYCPTCIAPPEVLYTVKLSHCFWNIHWVKTMEDIEFFQEKQVSHIPDLLDNLYAMWEKVHSNKDHITLNKSKEKFFNLNVKRKYPHDYLHEIVKFGEKPLYQECLKDGHEVLFDIEKFTNLSFESQLNCIREEIYVLSIERNLEKIELLNLLEENLKSLGVELYQNTLRNFILRYSKGFMAKWVACNYINLKYPNVNYLKKFLEYRVC